MPPDPASIAEKPKDYIEGALGSLPRETLRKVLHDHAARVYHLDQ